MKITSSCIAMESSHFSAHSYTQSTLSKIIGNVPKEVNTNDPSRQLNLSVLSDSLELSQKAMEKYNKEITQSKDGINLEDIQKLDIPEKDKQRIILIAEVLKALTGKNYQMFIPKDIKITPTIIDIENPNLRIHNINPENEVQWAAEFYASETYTEKETLSFKANGVINTSDGKQIQFDVNLKMSHEFSYSNSTDIRMGNSRLLDPLVINYDGPAASVTQTKFNFDIDSDGTKESLSTLTKGSGFLALDLNNDGQINDGSELFGTKSNNGFKDLAAYDSDHNNWIDENDPIFSKLRIWSVNEDGTKDLYTLGEKGIGAIYLGNVDAAFGMHDNSNKLQAEANSAGIFLKENGASGTMQQIDYVV